MQDREAAVGVGLVRTTSSANDIDGCGGGNGGVGTVAIAAVIDSKRVVGGRRNPENKILCRVIM